MRRAAWLLLSELAGLPLLVTAFAIVSDGARRSPGARARRRRLQEGHGARGAQAAGWCWPGSRHVGAADPLGEVAHESQPERQHCRVRGRRAARRRFGGGRHVALLRAQADAHRRERDTMADCGGPHQPPCTLFMRYFTWNFTMQMGWSIVTWILMGLTVVSFCACCCVSKR
ncbi:unnamed protein product [Prorocentrum cordatum]|uniref:Uncharacterized protein n=1 Tax=Prorocentrum cordatum TaxID=2364126 RepID=A0ABN9TA37_9DINO|nr:unnamed protein product [Polarella glacialis]